MSYPLFKKYASSNRVLIQVALFWKNVQIQPFFQDKLHFFRQMCKLNRFFEASYTFLKKCATPTDFSRHVALYQEMCNSNHFFETTCTFLNKYATSTSFSRQVALFSRNVQMQTFFKTCYTFLKKCAIILFYMYSSYFLSNYLCVPLFDTLYILEHKTQRQRKHETKTKLDQILCPVIKPKEAQQIRNGCKAHKLYQRIQDVRTINDRWIGILMTS
jgi:hypothetical protein